ncbi:MAG: ABC transporter ATP-binding protein [Oscillospiraceae bacterium]
MIKADNLCKVFVKNENTKDRKISFFSKTRTKSEFYAVDHVSFTAQDGEILGILGPNGAGKTTLLRIISSLMTATEGTVSITDKDGKAVDNPLELKRKIGYISGNTKLYSRMSIREILKIFGTVYGMSDEEIEKKSEEIFTILNMKSFCDNRIEKLSTGQTQRASIARCLIHSPDIYIFDEPTLGLDIISSESIIRFMKSEKEKGRTVIYSTHYMEEAEFLCDRIIMINKGKIIAEGTPEKLRNDTGAVNLREAFKKLTEKEGIFNEF